MVKVLGASVFGLVSFVACLAGATTAAEGGNASSPEGDRRANEPLESHDDAWRPRATASYGWGATVGGTGGEGYSFRGMVGVEPKPWLFLGASYRRIHAEGGEWQGVPETFDTHFASAALEVHPLGRFWADPYATADLGYSHFSRESGETRESNDGDWGPPVSKHGVGTGLGLGFAFRGDRFAVGPQASLMFMTPGAVSATAELRLDARF